LPEFAHKTSKICRADDFLPCKPQRAKGPARPTNRVFCLPASTKLAGKDPQARQAVNLSGGKTISSVYFLRRKPLCPRIREGGFFVVNRETFSKHRLLEKPPLSHKNRFLEVQSEIIC
jgi:hypothetical protein